MLSKSHEVERLSIDEKLGVAERHRPDPYGETIHVLHTILCEGCYLEGDKSLSSLIPRLFDLYRTVMKGSQAFRLIQSDERLGMNHSMVSSSCSHL